MSRRSERRRRRRAAPDAETSLSPADRHRHRAFEAARRAAIALGKGLAASDGPGWPNSVPDPSRIERYRWLLVAMGTARGTPGALAIAGLARRGYVLTPRISSGAWDPQALDWISFAWFGAGLPWRRDRRWRAMERAALEIDASALPPLDVVSAHVSLAIRRELRRQGHDLG